MRDPDLFSGCFYKQLTGLQYVLQEQLRCWPTPCKVLRFSYSDLISPSWAKCLYVQRFLKNNSFPCPKKKHQVSVESNNMPPLKVSFFCWSKMLWIKKKKNLNLALERLLCIYLRKGGQSYMNLPRTLIWGSDENSLR